MAEYTKAKFLLDPRKKTQVLQQQRCWKVSLLKHLNHICS